MEFEFDPRKSERNEELHGVSLDWAQSLWDQNHLIIPAKSVAGEAREMILARVEREFYVAVFTMRKGAIRLISCHRADARLERLYEDEVRRRKAH